MTTSRKSGGLRRALSLIILVPVLSMFTANVFTSGKADTDAGWNVLMDSRDTDAAIRLCTRAIRFGRLAGDDLARAHECLATAAMRQDKYAEARKEMQTVNALRPDYPGGLRLLGEACLAADDTACALENFSSALRLLDADGKAEGSAGLARIYALRGHTRLDTGDKAGGIADLSRAFAMAPEDPAVLYHYGFALEAQGKQREALDMLERAWAEKTHDLFSTFMLSKEGQEWLSRLVELRMALNFDPMNPAPPLEGSPPDHRFDPPEAPSFSPLDENPAPEMFE